MSTIQVDEYSKGEDTSRHVSIPYSLLLLPITLAAVIFDVFSHVIMTSITIGCIEQLGAIGTLPLSINSFDFHEIVSNRDPGLFKLGRINIPTTFGALTS